MTPNGPARDVTRDFTVAVFVVHAGKTLLHYHPKLGKWLPPGGHIEPNELPDEAARREVAEEAGIDVQLVGARGLPNDYPNQPIQLVVPAGIQLEFIGPGHEHIDLVYFAVPLNASDDMVPACDDAFEWLGPADLVDHPVSDEVRDWCERAVREVAGRPSAGDGREGDAGRTVRIARAY
ncbi:MAG: NUDIX domain-containing protein [Chloroflexota bacterium]|nr:NUDIX domain-containing protein [Chloroflexota bacterium]